MSNLPEFAGQLSIDFLDDFNLEKSWHCTAEYIAALEDARSHVTENSVCCFCGFPDNYFLEIHHIDDDHSNFQEDNLTFICTLCHRLKHLGWVGTANLGRMFYLPSLVQNDSRFWLEPFSHVQRFYLMQGFLSSAERERLKLMPLHQNAELLQKNLRSQDVASKYFAGQSARAEYLKDLDDLQKVDADKKKEKLDEIKKKRIERQAVLDDAESGNDFANIHILDLLTAINDSGKKHDFLAEQNEGKKGRLAVWFNLSVFEPFEPVPTYTLADRLAYYQDLNFFSSTGLQNVMQNLRQQKMGMN